MRQRVTSKARGTYIISGLRIVSWAQHIHMHTQTEAHYIPKQRILKSNITSAVTRLVIKPAGTGEYLAVPGNNNLDNEFF